MKKNYHIIGACSCWGAQVRSCERGPEALVEGQVFDRLQKLGILIQTIEMVYPKKKAAHFTVPLPQSLPLIHDFNLQLMRSVRQAISNGSFPIILGGDHSNAVGTWNAIEEPFGLIWIDAHMDAHTPETTPSGAYHGMPVADLLGYGLPELAQLSSKKPILNPRNLVLIGARSFEEGEEELLKKLNVKIYFIEEVKRRGLAKILPEAIEYVMHNVSRLGISLDLDIFTVEDAPGVGSPEKNGIHPNEILPLLHQIAKDPRLVAFEIVEFNPERDVDHKTRELIFKILQEIMR